MEVPDASRGLPGVWLATDGEPLDVLVCEPQVPLARAETGSVGLMPRWFRWFLWLMIVLEVLAMTLDVLLLVVAIVDREAGAVVDEREAVGRAVQRGVTAAILLGCLVWIDADTEKR